MLTLATKLACFCLLFPSLASAQAPHVVEHSEVYRQPGRFAGWPANNGMWNWGDEIVVGFNLGVHKETGGHSIDREKPQTTQLARSLDGGVSWKIETPEFVDELSEETVWRTAVKKTPIDFKQPGFAARFRIDRFYYSTDRGRHWHGPFQLPKFGRPGLLARTDYVVEGMHRMTAFVAAEKDAGKEGQPLCMRTTDGGRTWKLVGWIGKQPPPGYGYSIMPASIGLDGGGYLTLIRRGAVFDGQKRWWLEGFVSPDDGRSWYLLDQPNINNAGNPASLLRLSDGRVALIYGWRSAPYGIRARLSEDDGQTWSEELILRDDGASWDLGYPRTVQRLDGKLVTTYYFHDRTRRERYIGATIWQP